MDDLTLLRKYAASHSEAAFETLVSRHLRLVYSAAMRQIRDPHLAEEVTQAVFIILAKKAGRISDDTILSGWLYKTTRFVAMAQTREAARRRQYEQESNMQSEDQFDAPNLIWDQISPLLDEALAQLGEKDRQAVLLRFFEDKGLAEVGSYLGSGEDAARMRINRALEKLQRYFNRRGISSTTGIIAGAISANSVQAVPPALAKSVTAVAVAKGAAASGSTLTLIKGALKIMAWTKAKTAVVVGVCVLLAAGTTTVAIYNLNKPMQGIPKGWSVLSGDVDQWNWTDGKLNAHSITGDSSLASGREFRDFTLSVIAGTTNRDADIIFRMQDAANGYLVLFVPAGTPWAADNGSFVSLVKRTAGDESELASYHGRGIAAAGQSAKITVTARGPWMEVRLNDVTVLRTKDATFDSGFIGLRIYGDSTKPCDATFSNLTFH